jgi:IS30 family transposase
MIDTRPAEVESRAVVGHWEGDLIQGAAKTGNLVTVVERNTRFTLVGRTDTKEAAEVTAALCAMFLAVPLVAKLGPRAHLIADPAIAPGAFTCEEG